MSESFIYANGRISAEETALLDNRMWQMLMSASGEDEVLRLLGDTWYGRFMQYHSMEDCFIRAMEATEEELIELSEDRRLVRGILHRRDVRNARYIWKNILLGTDPHAEVEVERPGLIDIDVMKRSVESAETREELPAVFRETLEELAGSPNLEGGEFDRALDKLAAKVELEELTGINRGFRKFVRTHIEQKNFITAGRCTGDGVPRNQLESMLLDGGFHDAEEVAEAYQRGSLPDLLEEVPGFEAAAAALSDALSNGTFYEFQRECDRMLLELLQKGAFPVFGPSPLAAFVIRRELEIRHLRLLLAAKSADVSTDRLKQRLPRG